MKNLPIQSAGYALLIAGFTEWLDVQGYSKGTLQGLSSGVREFLHYLEQEGCKRIDKMDSGHLRGHYAHLTQRANKRRGGGLSNSSIHQHVQALTKFLQYLHHRGVQDLPSLGIKVPKVERPPIAVLSREDVAELYKACEAQDGEAKAEAARARDRAMLAVYYGCGLRLNEGVHLRLDDIDLEKRTIMVRKGKNYKERLVPMGKAGAQQLQEWIYEHRPVLLGAERVDALLVSQRGKAMTGGMIYARFKVVQQQVESPELRTKAMGLHALRHAIATHLLAAGMELQKIARFLGHSSMDSTQIYTHLAEEDDGNVR